MKFPERVMAVGFLLALSSCATATVDYHKPPSEFEPAAQLQGYKYAEPGIFTGDMDIYVMRVDGRPIDRKMFSGSPPVRVAPGTHEVEVGAWQSGGGFMRSHQITRGTAKIRVTLEAGSKYTIRSNYVSDALLFQVWLEDDTSKAVVGDKVSIRLETSTSTPTYIPVVPAK